MNPGEGPLAGAMTKSTCRSNGHAAAEAAAHAHARAHQWHLYVAVGSNMAYCVGIRAVFLLRDAKVQSHWSEVAHCEVTHVDNLPKVLKLAKRRGWNVSISDPGGVL